MSKRQLRSITTLMPSRKKILQKHPTKMILVKMNKGFKLFSTFPVFPSRGRILHLYDRVYSEIG